MPSTVTAMAMRPPGLSTMPTSLRSASSAPLLLATASALWRPMPSLICCRLHDIEDVFRDVWIHYLALVEKLQESHHLARRRDAEPVFLVLRQASGEAPSAGRDAVAPDLSQRPRRRQAERVEVVIHGIGAHAIEDEIRRRVVRATIIRTATSRSGSVVPSLRSASTPDRIPALPSAPRLVRPSARGPTPPQTRARRGSAA